MSFDSLINVKMPEAEIFDRVVEILQKNFFAYQEVNVCLPLNEIENDLCSVKEVRYYKLSCEKDIEAKRQFMCLGEYQQVFAVTKYMGDFYQASLFGHFVSIHADIYTNSIQNLHKDFFTIDRATWKTIPYEIVSKAFAELKEALTEKKSG